MLREVDLEVDLCHIQFQLPRVIKGEETSRILDSGNVQPGIVTSFFPCIDPSSLEHLAVPDRELCTRWIFDLIQKGNSYVLMELFFILPASCLGKAFLHIWEWGETSSEDVLSHQAEDLFFSNNV